MKYDVFISYRRKAGNGLEIARVIDTEIDKTLWYKSYLDYNELKDDEWHPQLLEAIDSAPVFLYVLTEGSLDRCIDEGDCVRQEIFRAVEKKKHIVPVNPDGKVKWTDIPEEVRAKIPEEIRAALFDIQQSEISLEQLFKASIKKLIKERISPYVPRVIFLKRLVYSLVSIFLCLMMFFAGTLLKNHVRFNKAYERYEVCIESARQLMARHENLNDAVYYLNEADSLSKVYSKSLLYSRYFDDEKKDLIDELFIFYRGQANRIYDSFTIDFAYRDEALYYIDLALMLHPDDKDLITKKKIINNLNN